MKAKSSSRIDEAVRKVAAKIQQPQARLEPPEAPKTQQAKTAFDLWFLEVEEVRE